MAKPHNTWTIITPLAADRDNFFYDCAEALIAAANYALLPEFPHWRIQIDGNEPSETLNQTHETLVQLGIREYCSLNAHGYQAGAAKARTIALYHTPVFPTPWLLTIDADDVFLPNIFTLLNTTLHTSTPDTKWIAGGVLIEKETAHTRPIKNAFPWSNTTLLPPTFPPHTQWLHLPPLLPPGETQPRTILDYMETHDNIFPIFAATTAYHTSTIWKLGGWPTTPTGEDAALLGKVSDLHSGFILANPLIAYRQHPQQNTKNSWHSNNRHITWRIIQETRPPEN